MTASAEVAGGEQVSSALRIRSLDGLRAFAILLVLLSHLWDTQTSGSSFLWEAVDGTGELGVDLFFVISGFIITHLLLNERESTGRISLWRFYARRALRLWPALWLYLAVVLVLNACGKVQLMPEWIIAPVLFLSDYLQGSLTSVTHHTWSLAVEEQFYLLWPFAVIRLGRGGLRRLLILAILAAPVIRVLFALAFPVHRFGELFFFHTRYDFLAVGCLLALEYRAGAAWIARMQRIPTVVPVVALILLEAVAMSTQSYWFRFSVGYTLQALLFGIIVISAITASEGSIASRTLNTRVLRHIGLISYSLYLWQQLFVTSVAFAPFTEPVIGLAAGVLCAEASFRLVERPLASVRARLHPGPVAGTRTED